MVRLVWFLIGGVEFEVSFAAPGKVPVVFDFVWSSAFLAFRAMGLA